jgi:hypothetical protein
MKRMILAALAVLSLSVGVSSLAFASNTNDFSAPVQQSNGQG